jgi:hypothetical protein
MSTTNLEINEWVTGLIRLFLNSLYSMWIVPFKIEHLKIEHLPAKSPKVYSDAPPENLSHLG